MMSWSLLVSLDDEKRQRWTLGHRQPYGVRSEYLFTVNPIVERNPRR